MCPIDTAIGARCWPGRAGGDLAGAADPARALTAVAGSRFAHHMDGFSAPDRQRSALDYLAIGSNQDFINVPLAYAAATAVARDFGCVLPTAKMVDAIHAQAARRLEPAPLPAGPLMRTAFPASPSRDTRRRLC
jgi:hypothetical protein